MIQPLVDTAGLASATDEALMKAITNRRQTALRELYDRYGKTVKAVVVRVVHEEAEADDPLPAGCEVSNGVVAVLDDTIAVRLEPTGVELDRATARAGVLELRATNAGTADDTLTIADNRGQIVGAILAGAGLVCPGHFRLPPGSYRLRWGATEAALTLRPG